MDQKKIDRINELARKMKTDEGLTEAEAKERKELHAEYIASVRRSLEAHLDNTVLVDEHGNKKKVRKNPNAKKKGH